MDLQTLQEFLFWCMVINLGLLTLSALLIMSLRPWICQMHGRFFNLSEDDISKVLYAFLGFYKIVVIVFNVVPWIALQIMT